MYVHDVGWHWLAKISQPSIIEFPLIFCILIKHKNADIHVYKETNVTIFASTIIIINVYRHSRKLLGYVLIVNHFSTLITYLHLRIFPGFVCEICF